jgi:hypothetical protein
MTYVGIDYGFKQTNISPTGIRYGVIPINSVYQSWYDSAIPQYGNYCPYCGNEPKFGNDIHYMKRCPSCCNKLDDFSFMEKEAICHFLDDGEYKAHDDSQGDIFIILSPYFTYAQFCSPCAPGACYLTSFLDEPIQDNKCYCFGHDFFYEGKAPYPVYSVETGEKV